MRSASGVEKPRAGLGDHHRIDDNWRARGQLVEHHRHRERQLALVEHPHLDGVDAMSSSTARDLGEHDLARQRVDRVDTGGVLRGDRGDGPSYRALRSARTP